MSKIERVMKRRRKNEYRYLKSLFKARDAAKPYLKGPMRISQLRKYAASPFRNETVTPIYVVDHEHIIIHGPPKPPPRQKVSK